jgi:hypothetical protein
MKRIFFIILLIVVFFVGSYYSYSICRRKTFLGDIGMPENPVEILDFYSNGVDDVWVFNCDKLFIEKCIKTHKLVKTNDLDYIIKNIFYISNINFDINLRDYIIYVSTSGKINLFLIHRKPTEEKIYSFVLIIRA